MSEEIREILPKEGLWTVQDLADYLEMQPSILQQQLMDYGIKTLAFSSRFKHKLIKLEDVASKIGTIKHATK